MRISRRVAVAALAAGLTAIGAGLIAQPGAAPRKYHNGSVWGIEFIRIKPGMDEAYMGHLAGQWKDLQEAMKKESVVVSYKVLGCESHGANDFNLLLMTEYKDLATMEANEPKEDALAQRTVGDDQKQMQGYKDRSEIREVVGSRLAREMVLEPRQ